MRPVPPGPGSCPALLHRSGGDSDNPLNAAARQDSGRLAAGRGRACADIGEADPHHPAAGVAADSSARRQRVHHQQAAAILAQRVLNDPRAVRCAAVEDRHPNHLRRPRPSTAKLPWPLTVWRTAFVHSSTATLVSALNQFGAGSLRASLDPDDVLDCLGAATATAPDLRCRLGHVAVTAPGGWAGPGVPAGLTGPCYRVADGRKRRSRRLLVTTNTELKAMAAPAISGLRNPAAASGMAAVL